MSRAESGHGITQLAIAISKGFCIVARGKQRGGRFILVVCRIPCIFTRSSGSDERARPVQRFCFRRFSIPEHFNNAITDSSHLITVVGIAVALFPFTDKIGNFARSGLTARNESRKQEQQQAECESEILFHSKTSIQIYYKSHLYAQFWHNATFLFCTVVLPVSLRRPTRSQRPHVQIISIKRQKPHKHPVCFVLVLLPTCSIVTVTFSLPHFGHFIDAPPYFRINRSIPYFFQKICIIFVKTQKGTVSRETSKIQTQQASKKFCKTP